MCILVSSQSFNHWVALTTDFVPFLWCLSLKEIANYQTSKKKAHLYKKGEK